MKRHGDYFKMFVPCEPSQRCPLVSPPLAGEELEALDRHLRSRAGGEPEGRGKEALLKRWKGLRSSGPRTRVAGLPPSWARKASRGRTPVLPPGTDPGSVVTFRRKLIQKDTKAPRPAYYGSWSRARSAALPALKEVGEEGGA